MGAKQATITAVELEAAASASQQHSHKLLEHSCDMIDIYGGLEAAKRLAKWLREKEMLMMQCLWSLEQGLQPLAKDKHH